MQDCWQWLDQWAEHWWPLPVNHSRKNYYKEKDGVRNSKRRVQGTERVLILMRMLAFLLSHLGSDNSTLLILFSFFHNKFSSLSILSSHLFSFDCSSKFFPKSQACNGHIIQCNVKIGCSCCQNLPYFSTNSL